MTDIVTGTGAIELPPEAPPEITELLRLAVEKGADVEALEKLVGLYERVEDRRAATPNLRPRCSPSSPNVQW